MEEKIRAHIIVSGRVQGVYFREQMRKGAKKLNVSGWVKNLEDGRVEAIFEGEKGKVEKIIDWVKQGPAFAKVKDIELEWQEYRGEFKNFKVRH